MASKNFITDQFYDYTKQPDVTSYTNLQDFKNALELGDHVFYVNLKIPIIPGVYNKNIFQASHHGIYVGVQDIAAERIAVDVRKTDGTITSQQFEVEPESNEAAIIHISPQEKKNASNTVKLISLPNFFKAAARSKSAVYIIRHTDTTKEDRQRIADQCLEKLKDTFVFSAVNNNCETFVNSCIYGDDKHPSLISENYKKLRNKVVGVGVGAGVLGLGATAVLSKNKKKLHGGSGGVREQRSRSRCTSSRRRDHGTSYSTSRKSNRRKSRKTSCRKSCRKSRKTIYRTSRR